MAAATSYYLLRGDCNPYGFGLAPPPVAALLEGEPDMSTDIRALPQSLPIFRLSCDLHPNHADQAAAASGGFEQQLPYGLCSIEIAMRACDETG